MKEQSMPLHRLLSLTVGIPDVTTVRDFYLDFGLRDTASSYLSTRLGGGQLKLVPSGRRELRQIELGAENPDDLADIASRLRRLDVGSRIADGRLIAADPGSGVEVVVRAAEPLPVSAKYPHEDLNGPGGINRRNRRASVTGRDDPVRPARLGHVVFGSPDQPASELFFTQGLGFKISDSVPGRASFMRCSTDHHNVLIQQAPVTFLHHTSWQVDDIDEVGRGATALIEKDPERHMWGLGRHHIGSNFFWYLKDPAGNFAEYYSDMDCIVDDELWKPEVFDGKAGLYSWGPPPPADFLRPEDLADLIASHHG
jgi:catechol 2,3-dioxygenase-like lactoylglutathione lyase family enzyme